MLLCSLVLFGGCAFDPAAFKTQQEVKIVKVETPLLYCPAPPDFEYPRLIIEDLVPGDEADPGRVVQYWKASVKQLEGEVKKRDIILKAYKQIQTTNPNLTPVDVERTFNEMIKNETAPVNK